jgi:hypothetical protein
MSDFPEMEYKPIADGEGLQVLLDTEPLEFLMRSIAIIGNP